jgi:type IV secretion system protein VirB10
MEEAAERHRPRVAGERGIVSINRGRSLQSRLSNLLALGLMGGLGVGLLGWYYAHAFARQAHAREHAKIAAQAKVQGEMALPPLGPIDPPTTAPAAQGPTAANSAAPVTADPSAVERVLGPAPPLLAASLADPAPPVYGARPSSRVPRPVGQRAADRRLDGPVFSGVSANGAPNGGAAAGADALDAAMAGPPAEPRAVTDSREVAPGPQDQLAALLKPSVIQAVQAQVLPTQSLLLPKGAFIDCTLETAIDSSLPGLTTCVTATDTFGADGKVVLLERGTKLVGETRGEVQQGSARVFVLWTEARTPTGVVVPLASPGTDELGRSGLPGAVNNHFFERFGAAMLISVLDGAVQASAAANSRGGAVIYDPASSEDVMTGVLKSTVNVAPTVIKQNGDRIQVLVARDLDFRSVYELRVAAAAQRP